ncbi:pilus assembly protein [Vibrio fluvialis]|uniref:TadE/TadG family type IV pilus assembly protein n=1 Tax=Vibrio fluvialis TaxID=676 RepID=UPI00192C764A|nr:TadE/TadG family type IV pilus assembly protein [Vibrio fluvialis]EKO3438176.1 pilus assembly protein [Vibrio fluvialis]EKO3485814.1 pilus assembly protein [Vibrio fluvialis]MBL4259769.1 pilus assembly protein [Vibrio fluvialis]MBY7816484.1 pilus assembly protein [Vibrio fluvialis]
MASRRISKHRGLAAVEFLITLPALLLILTGIVEFGNAFIKYSTLSKLVQNGSRYAVTDIYGTSNSDQIADEANIKNMVVYGNKSGSGNSLLDTLTVDDVVITHADKYVVVSATYTYVPILNIIPQDYLSNLKMSSSALMRTTL